MIISSAGAEGISLTCVRQVHILEPFWNYVRIDQVLGRAIRMKSHLDLPKEDRNVEQYLYLSVLPKGITLETAYESLKNDPNKTWIIPEWPEDSVKAELSKPENQSEYCNAFMKNIRESVEQNKSFVVNSDMATRLLHCT